MKGIYCLWISVDKDVSLKIGALGVVGFEKGNYVYVGSAQNNLQKRVERHLSKEKKFHWHIDYFLDSPYINVKDVFVKEGSKEECETAKSILGKEILKFGCSDCKCKSHLIKVESDTFKKLENLSFKKANKTLFL